LNVNKWWHKPRLIDSEDASLVRKVTWLELFYDLVFVVVIAELSHRLSLDVSIKGVAGFISLFIPIWMAWVMWTFYNERFETAGVDTRIFTFLQMLAIAAMAVFTHDALGTTFTGFTLSYVALLFLIIFLWLRAGWHEKIFWPLSKSYGLGLGLSAVIFISSIFFSPPIRFYLWWTAVLIELLIPVLTNKYRTSLPKFITSKFPERFGLFMIIIFGESIVSVIQGIARNHQFGFTTALHGILGMGMVFGMWCMYFDVVARRNPKKEFWSVILWAYLHLPLAICWVAIATGILNLIADSQNILSANVRWLLSGAFAIGWFVIGLIELKFQKEDIKPVHQKISLSLKWGAGIVALSLAVWGKSMNSILFTGILILLLLVQIIYSSVETYGKEI
jgi:low temperature requirement protein LtrA